MAVVDRTKGVFENLVDFLDISVGLIFEKGKGPKNAEGMLRHPCSMDAKWEKFYFSPKGANLLEDGVKYVCPPSMKGALFGELALKAVGSFRKRHVSQKVSFGRFSEEKPFEFKDESSYIFLRIARPEKWKFNPLYIRHKLEDGYEYFVLMVRWEGDHIALKVFPRTIEQVPPHLAEEEK